MSQLRSTPTYRRGITLPEVITTAALFMLLLTGLISMSLGASKGYSADSSKMMADDTVSTGLQAMAKEVRGGLRYSVNEAGNSLAVVMPYVNDQGDYDRTRDGDTIQYYLSSGNLYRKRNTENARVVGRNVSSLKFTKNGIELGIQMTCSQQVGTRTSVTTMNTQVTLRNEPL